MTGNYDLEHEVSARHGRQAEHRKRIITAAIAIPALALLVGGIWYLEANVSEDLAYAVMTATFAVVAAVLAYEVLTIGSQGRLNTAWRVAGAVVIGSIPVALSIMDYVYAFGAGISSRPYSDPIPMNVRIAILSAVASPFLLAIACVAVRRLLPRSLAVNVILGVLFALYGAIALGLVPVAIRLVDFFLFGIVIALIVLVFVADTSAYYIGRQWGIRKLAPKISPNKTWAGLIGGMIVLGSLVTVPILPFILLESFFNLSLGDPAPPQPTLLMGFTTFLLWTAGYFLFGSMIAAVGTAGDLFASWFKRQAGVKDSGRLFPGHGGLLDRIDSLIPNLAVFSVFSFGFILPLIEIRRAI